MIHARRRCETRSTGRSRDSRRGGVGSRPRPACQPSDRRRNVRPHSGTGPVVNNRIDDLHFAMAEIRVSESALVPAPASLTYDIIADYRTGHPSILPTEYFGRLDVLEGGRGAGT